MSCFLLGFEDVRTFFYVDVMSSALGVVVNDSSGIIDILMYVAWHSLWPCDIFMLM